MNAADQQDKLSALVKQGVDIVQMELPDLNGGLRGKFYAAEKIKPTSKGGVCTIVYQFTPADDVWMSEYSSYENGFPDVIGVPDPDTAIVLPWRTKQAAVLYDVEHLDGRPYPLSPRSVLRAIEKRVASAGYEAKFGVEFECFILHADVELIAQGAHHKMAPLGRMHHAYRLTEANELRDLAAEFIRRMKGVGIIIEVFHTELGNGAVEFALAPESALRAADNALRAKTYLRELCKERGLVVTFMAKWDAKQSGSGGHVHQSLWREGKNLFYDPRSGDISEIARQYMAGMLTTMGDCIALFRPVINSYRRIDHKAWAPENVSWGYDNRCAALRVIRYPSESACRVEHRIPGADASTYLAIAAMLAGGHYGIEKKLKPMPASVGNPSADTASERLPDTLPDATERFRNSAFCREYMGEEFVDHYARSRDVEWEHWCAWQKANISRFELERYFDTV
ncbi:glutamine synthetase family protein [Mesorhizobium sp. CO1-1-8]|uniref:glutamine synthetase family protein n=1 Tax=Mesorhizobium sp. CO1-1-8 TaxID=2876631 RepID=UPI001CD1923D|nr:glutamine synthetase family protein [Mesorhizobium sp. CO1-1-8]MBZ9772453.1 glutamine synthetase family protein [Mesorhizobium sp. CO1-1-8]